MNVESDGTSWHGIASGPPNGPAAIIFIAAFGAGTIGHFGMIFWLRTWYFIPFLIGCITESLYYRTMGYERAADTNITVETFGYYGRFWLSQSPSNFKAYVLYDLLVLPAPIFLAATMYMSISRIVVALDAAELSPIRPNWLGKIFVLGDVICFLVQLSGTGLTITIDAKMQDIGRIVVVVGLVFQILVFICFIWAVAIFYRRCKSQAGADGLHWKRFIIALLAASMCIVLRNLVIGIGHAQRGSGLVSSHEVFAYLFEAVPIFAVVSLLLVFHPGRLQRSVKGLKVLHDGGQEMEMEERSGLVPTLPNVSLRESKFFQRR